MSWLTNLSSQALGVPGVGALPAGWSAQVPDEGPGAVRLYEPEVRDETGRVVEAGCGGLSPELFGLQKTKPAHALVLGVDDQPSSPGAAAPSLLELTERGRELHDMQPDDGVPADLVLDAEPVVLVPSPESVGDAPETTTGTTAATDPASSSTSDTSSASSKSKSAGAADTTKEA